MKRNAICMGNGDVLHCFISSITVVHYDPASFPRAVNCLTQHGSGTKLV